MDHDDVQRWLDGYISAWRSGDRDAIGALFTEDARYSYRPWDSEEHTVAGRESIVDSWLEDPDDPSNWEATYRPYAVDGDRAVAVGSTEYFDDAHQPERRYSNAFILAFQDGRCSEFHEFYVRDKR
jgi:ketosteroid isomerase-like protein